MSDTPYRSLKGPFLNFLVRSMLFNKVKPNMLDVNIIAFLVQRYNNLNFFSFTDFMGNILPINLELVKSFAAFGVEEINQAYPPTETELEDLSKLINPDYLPKMLMLLDYLHTDIELTGPIKEEVFKVLDDYDLELSNEKIILDPLPNDLNYIDLLFYRNYKISELYNIDTALLKSIVQILKEYHIDSNSKVDLEVDDKIIFYAKLNSKKILKDSELEINIHTDRNLIDFYKIVDPLLHLSGEVINKSLHYINKLNSLCR